MSRIRWGVIGAGDVVRRKSGPALLAEPRSSLAAICSGGGNVTALAAQFGARAYDDVLGVIADRAVDAFYVAAPPHLHEKLVMAVLKARKPIVVEKPIAPDADAGARMVAAARAAGVSLSVAYYRRCDPRLARLLAMVEAGAVGRVRRIEMRQLRTDGASPLDGWRADPAISPGGRFSDSHSHALDWLIWAFGPLVRHSAAQRGSALAYALELETCEATGVFDPDADKAADSLTVHGDGGVLSTSFFDPGPVRLSRDGGMIEQDLAPPPTPHLPFFTAMAAHVLDGAGSPCSAGDALGASQVIDTLFLPKLR